MKKEKMKRFLLLTVALFLFSTTVCLAETLGKYSSDKNTVLLLHFNEDSGQTAKDESDCGNNGTLGPGESGPTWTSSGRFEGALRFDGIDDYVDCGNNSSLDIMDEITIEMWINQDTDASGSQSLLNSATNWDSGYFPHILDNGSLRFFYNSSGTRYSVSTSIANGVIKGKWVHLAFVFKDATHMYIYKNGNIVSSSPRAMTCSHAFTGVNIGKKAAGYFKGLVDEVRISNKARSLNKMVASESLNWGSVIFPKRSGIKSEKIAKWLIKKAPKNEHLVVYWRMDKKSITKDKKGPNDAKIFGAALTPDGLKFDGVNDYIDCGNPPELNFGAEDFTMGFWIKSSEPVKGPLFEKKESAHRKRVLISFGEGKPHFNVEHTGKGTMYAYMTGTTMLEPDKWYHIMYVADRSKRHPLIYVNGILEDVAQATQGSWKRTVSSKGNAYLGKSKYHSKITYFNGTIAEFSVWKGVALTANEVKTIYNHDKDGFNGSTGGELL